MKSLIAVFISLSIFLIGCFTSNSNNPQHKDSANSDGSDKYIVITHDCDLQIEVDSINKNQLIGSWIDSLIWLPSDSCFVGCRALDGLTRIDFYSNGRYKLMNTYNDTIKNYTEEGEYWTQCENDSCTVVLAEWYGDEPIQVGDTVIYREWVVHSLSESILRIRPGINPDLNAELKEFRKN